MSAYVCLYRPEDDLRFHSLGAIHVIFVEIGSLAGLDSISKLNWLSSEPQYPSVYTSQSWYCRHTPPHTPRYFTWILGIQTQILMLGWASALLTEPSP